MKEIPYFFILDCWIRKVKPCIDCGKNTPFYVRFYLRPLCVSCYRVRAQANTLGEVCCVAPHRG